MSTLHTAEQEKRWTRPSLDRSGPIRGAGGFFRTAEMGQSGLGGVPLTSAEDAVVAAVRMAYKVAETQVDRSARLAQRLRQAGDRAAGPHSDRQGFDATEQLVFRAMMSALGWLEAAATERDGSLRQMLIAQYRFVGSLFGLAPVETPKPSPHETPDAGASGDGSAPLSQANPSEGDGSLTRVEGVTVVLEGEHKRPVRTRLFETRTGAPVDTPVRFYSVAHIESAPLAARLMIDTQNHVTLAIEVQRVAPMGLWKAAVCDERGMQIGMIAIEL
jgi:hypothetical protein